MAENNPYRQLDPASHSDARMWREYDASRPPNETIGAELADRKRALASIDEVHGEWEGDDYWALGSDPNETGAQGLERLRREEQQRGNGLGYGVADDSDTDSEGSSADEEEFEECESDSEYPDGERPVRMPASLLTEDDIMYEASFMAWDVYGNSRIVDFVVAYERLLNEVRDAEGYEALRPQIDPIVDAAYRLAARFDLPRPPLDEILEAANDRLTARLEEEEEEERQQKHQELMEALDMLADDLLKDQQKLQGVEELIAYQQRLFKAGMFIWQRDSPEGAAKFLRFVEAAQTSLEAQYEGPTSIFQHSIYCWAIGVFDIPDFQVDIIRRLARLQYQRALLTCDILELKLSEHEYMRDEDAELDPWKDCAASKKMEAFNESADGQACELLHRCHGRYGYEHQTITSGKVQGAYGYADFIEPADVPFLRRLEIIRAGFDIRIVRHGQALRNPASIRPLAMNRHSGKTVDSHDTVPLGFFKWIKDAIIHLAEDPHQRSPDELEARRELCEDMLNFSATLDKEKRVRSIMTHAVKHGLVPFAAFESYRGGSVCLPANARPKMIRDIESLARRERKCIVVLGPPPPEPEREVVER